MSNYIPIGSGIYTLIIGINQPKRVKIGGLGYKNFDEGIYTYTGSALGKSTNLHARITRHLSSKKKNHWHIDYLLDSKGVEVQVVVYVNTVNKGECRVTKSFEKLTIVKTPIKGFGSSDCIQKCIAHLHLFHNVNLEETLSWIINVYNTVFNGSLVSVIRVS